RRLAAGSRDPPLPALLPARCALRRASLPVTPFPPAPWSSLSDVLVPLQVLRRRADADDVHPLVGIEVRGGTAGGRHRSFVVERALGPARAVGGRGVEHRRPGAAALTDDHFVAAV